MRADAPGSFQLQTRKTGETTWATQDTQPTVAAKDETAVLTATGLEPATMYDYRVLLDTVQVATSTTFTMPTSGRFVVYHISDGHGGNQVAFDRARTDWEANFEPSSIPAVIFQTGDLYELAATETTKVLAGAVARAEVAEISGSGRAGERIPIVFMWNDWDFAGNNTSKDRQIAFTGEPDAQAAALDFWTWYWRDHPQPAAPSLGHTTVVASIPFIALDVRSQRKPQTNLQPLDQGVTGAEPFTPAVTFLGDAQRTWLKSEIAAYADRGLVVLISTDTLTSQRGDHPGTFTAGTRDSIGIWWKGERNHVLDEAVRFGYGNKRNLIVWSGDDHWNVVWDGIAGAPNAYNAGQHPGSPPLALGFYEFKVVSAASGPVGNAPVIFGGGDRADNRTDKAIVRWDITSRFNGTDVTARVTYLKTSDGTTISSDSNSLTNEFDFYFENGLFEQFDPTNGHQQQTYPPDNGPGTGPQFLRSYLDDRLGTLHHENNIVRDEDHLLRRADDLGRRDRDWTLEGWRWPTERTDREPLE